MDTVEHILERVKTATKESRIAVLKHSDGLKALFFDTKQGRDDTIRCYTSLVGIYHKDMNSDVVETELRKAQAIIDRRK